MAPHTYDNAIDPWITALDEYTIEALSLIPAPGNWSIGQLYLHLINDTLYFITQARLCLSHNDHAGSQASEAAKIMLQKNEFPDELIEGNPGNAYIPQPASKEQLLNGFLAIREEIGVLTRQVRDSAFTGKTQHPGLGYFNGGEWVRFAAMHLRHHLRQKKRIDDFLQKNRRANPPE